MVFFTECSGAIGPKIGYVLIILAVIAFMVFEITMGNMENVYLYGSFIGGVVVSIIYLSFLSYISLDDDPEEVGSGFLTLLFTILILVPCILYYVTKSGIFVIGFVDNLIGDDEALIDNTGAPIDDTGDVAY